MAVTCGFFNSLGGDRKYPADDISRIFDGVIQDGVYMSIGDKFAVTATTGMTVNVGSGRAWFNHTWTLNDADLPILMDDPDLVLDRIDAIVLEINRSEEVRNNVIKAVKGTASSNPQNPVMVNTEFIEQVPFAYITRKHGVTEIKTEDIKIVVGTSECPYVTSILEAADIDELFAQWDAQFNTWQDSQKAEFTAWFEGIRGQLDEDPAGHLQNQINDIMNGQSVPSSGIAVYTHSRSGSVNELTGSGPNGRALITSDIQEGDTWTVNGSPVTAYMGAEEATSMMAGQPYTGRWVTFTFDGEFINFKGGGGSVTVEGLSAETVVQGKKVTVKQGSKIISDVSGTVPAISFFCGGGAAAADSRASGHGVMWIDNNGTIQTAGNGSAGYGNDGTVTGICHVRAGQTLRVYRSGRIPVNFTFDGVAYASTTTKLFESDKDVNFKVQGSGDIGVSHFTAIVY